MQHDSMCRCIQSGNALAQDRLDRLVRLDRKSSAQWKGGWGRIGRDSKRIHVPVVSPGWLKVTKVWLLTSGEIRKKKKKNSKTIFFKNSFFQSTTQYRYELLQCTEKFGYFRAYAKISTESMRKFSLTQCFLGV